jgi:murein L,D-transpeptidase YafK
MKQGIATRLLKLPGYLISKVMFGHACNTLYLPVILMSGFLYCGFTGKTDGYKKREVVKLRKDAALPGGSLRIVIDKSDYVLKLIDEKGVYAIYPVVFGAEPEKDKRMQGDRRTPEGTFKVMSVYRHKKWCGMLMLDYPTPEDHKKFERRKTEKIIADTALIGSAIGIHGTWPNEDYLIDAYQNWTNGCISLKNTHITELAGFIKPGTEVTIRK